MDPTTAQIITLTGLVVSGFIASNLDNLLLLVILQAANTGQRRAVLAGYFISCVVVIFAAMLGVVIGSALGAGLVGYLGLVPLLLGIRLLYLNWRSPPVLALEEAEDMKAGQSIWLSTFVLMLSNSGDSVALFLPLLAESGPSSLVVIVIAYLLMALLWGGFSCLISSRGDLARRIESRAEKIVPWIMILVGIYVLMDSATDTLVR
ncbi:MAG: cadmium resistance transporter [Halioglobus sp.]